MNNQIGSGLPATPSQRFTSRVISEFAADTVQPINLSYKQRRLIQGYFVVIDKTLKDAEIKRQAKNASNSNHQQYDNPIPYDWQHVNMANLALDAVHAARMGLDMREEAHLYPIPYANKKKGCYDITFMTGYAGMQYKAIKYALKPPKAVTIEVVYSTDSFKPYKKSRTNPCDTYDFEITNPFARGEIIGGFGYIEHENPSANELVIMSMDNIKKRAQKSSAEFWGTEVTGKKVYDYKDRTYKEADGWLDEMVRKTLVREVYSKKHIPIDPSKLDDDYQYFAVREVDYAVTETNEEANENANSISIDFPKTAPQQIQQAPTGTEINIQTNPEPEPLPAEQQTLPAADEEEYAEYYEAYEEPDF